MQFETISLLVGNRTCNAKCNFCVARMSSDFELTEHAQQINWRNFHKAAKLAQNSKVNNVIITSYGEPTIFPNHVTEYLKEIKNYHFPLIEMQTNGALIEKKPDKYQDYLKTWYELGLDIIAISIVHYDEEINRACYFPHFKKYINLNAIVKTLRDIGFTVKINCTMAKGWIDSPEKILRMIDYTNELGANQISLRPVSMPAGTIGQDIGNWVKKRQLSAKQLEEVHDFFSQKGMLLLSKSYGAKIYDIEGTNVCLTNCLTMNADPSNLRQLIFFPSGAVRYDWQYNAVLLTGWAQN